MADPKPILDPEGLSREEFYRFLERLHGDKDEAALKYEDLYFRLVKFFQWSCCSSAEDLADETLNRTARKLRAGEEEILNIEAFVWGIAKRIRQEGQKKNIKTVHFSEAPVEKLSDAGASIETIHHKIQIQKERECLRNCLMRLSPEDRELFLAYRVDKGHYLEKRRELAERFGLTPSALRVRIIRVREKLEKCVARCLGR